MKDLVRSDVKGSTPKEIEPKEERKLSNSSLVENDNSCFFLSNSRHDNPLSSYFPSTFFLVYSLCKINEKVSRPFKDKRICSCWTLSRWPCDTWFTSRLVASDSSFPNE